MDTHTPTHPPTHSERAQQITAIVARVAEVQRARKLSDRQLLEEFPDLGSTKTWRSRLLTGQLSGLNPDRLLGRLRRVAQILDGGTPDEVFYADAPFARELRARLGLLERQTSDRRILACLAANGCGKSSFARWAVAQARASRAVVRCRPTWRNRPIHICLGIARALGSDIETSNPAQAEETVVNLLRGQPRTVFIDQAHEGGVAVMHLLRAFIDETPARFVYLAYNTAFRLVLTSTTDAHVEAQAFLGRCVKPIFDAYKAGTLAEDVAFHLTRAADLSADTAASVASRVTRALRQTTNLRLLDDAIVAARASDDDDEAAADRIVESVYRLAGLDPRAAAMAGRGDE